MGLLSQCEICLMFNSGKCRKQKSRRQQHQFRHWRQHSVWFSMFGDDVCCGCPHTRSHTRAHAHTSSHLQTCSDSCQHESFTGGQNIKTTGDCFHSHVVFINTITAFIALKDFASKGHFSCQEMFDCSAIKFVSINPLVISGEKKQTNNNLKEALRVLVLKKTWSRRPEGRNLD